MRRVIAFESEADLTEFSLTAAFLQGRLDRTETVQWALASRLRPPAQEAVRRLVDQRTLKFKGDIWSKVWSLVLEFWERGAGPNPHDGLLRHNVEQRFRAQDLTGALVADLATLVAPKLQLEPVGESKKLRETKKKPRAISDVVRASITSEQEVDPRRLRISEINDRAFLIQAARALEVDIDYGLNLSDRLGWDIERDGWRLGFIRRVYYVLNVDPDEEPDRFDQGLAPAVKLLHSAVNRLAEIEPRIASGFVRAWLLRESKIYKRLWAALSFNPNVTPIDDVSDVLLSLDAEDFWDLHGSPEATELRARRFAELGPDAQGAILRRMRRGPPARRWGRGTDRARVKTAQRYSKARELRRLEVGGAVLPDSDSRWLSEALGEFPELENIPIDHDFLDGVRTRWRESDPDQAFDGLSGNERLQALETAFATPSNFSSDAAQRANDWLRLGANVQAVLNDLIHAPRAGGDYPLVWEHFGWAHSLAGRDAASVEVREEVGAVLSLLRLLPLPAARTAIEGISHWLSSWEGMVELKNSVGPIWLRLWPLAVDATNAGEDEGERLSFLTPSSDDVEPREFDTLNSAVGRLVGVFLGICPNLKRVAHPFSDKDNLRLLRNAIVGAVGRAGLIGKYRLIEVLGYFLRADRAWTETSLIAALKADDDDARLLWRALSGRSISRDVLQALAKNIVEKIVDTKMARDTRNRLLFVIIVHALDSLVRKVRPVVGYSTIQQVIRTVEPEVRAQAAEAVSRVQSEWPAMKNPIGTAEEIFEVAVAPFLREVWPQERSLVSPGTSKAFADIPAAAKGQFATAVQVVRRFIVPFDCWTLSDFGMHDFEDESKEFELIDDASKATALIELLDLAVGTSETAVVPYDLGKALERVRQVAPRVAEAPAFRRLAAAARLA